MSQVTKTKCDGCGREVEDAYTEIGWLKVNSLVRSQGRTSSTNQLITDAVKEADYCGVDCLVKGLDAARENRLVAESQRRLVAEAKSRLTPEELVDAFGQIKPGLPAGEILMMPPSWQAQEPGRAALFGEAREKEIYEKARAMLSADRGYIPK